VLSVASDLTYAWRAAVTSPGSDTNPENHTLLHRPPQTNPMANPRTIPTAGILTHLGFQRIDFADSVSRERAEGSRHARSVHRCHSNLQVYAGARMPISSASLDCRAKCRNFATCSASLHRNSFRRRKKDRLPALIGGVGKQGAAALSEQRRWRIIWKVGETNLSAQEVARSPSLQPFRIGANPFPLPIGFLAAAG
jgi:hypothetical protein